VKVKEFLLLLDNKVAEKTLTFTSLDTCITSTKMKEDLKKKKKHIDVFLNIHVKESK